MVAGMAVDKVAGMVAVLAVLLKCFDIKECTDTLVMHNVYRYGNTLIPVSTISFGSHHITNKGQRLTLRGRRIIRTTASRKHAHYGIGSEMSSSNSSCSGGNVSHHPANNDS